MAGALKKMISVGWVKEYRHHAADGFQIEWTEEGLAAIEAVWSIMEDLGEAGRGTDETTRRALGEIAVARFSDGEPLPTA